MPRTLKTYITNLGFFELAIAAPSMKAALEAWGMRHNAFHQGFAKQSDDPKIIAATTAQPGVVLKRAVGSKGKFCKDARLPASLPDIRPPRIETPKPRPRPAAKAKPARKTTRAEIISFEKERARREKQKASAQAKADKAQAAKQQARDVAEAALQRAGDRYEAAQALIAREQDKLDRRSGKEKARWDAEREKLQAALDKAER